MKTIIVAVTCALGAAACAGSHPPAQDPSSAAAETSGDPSAQPSASSVTVGSEATTTTTPATTQAPAPSATASTGPTTSTGATSMMATGPSVTPTPAPADPVRTASDNTRVNARDRQGTLTPINQGNSKAETAITASIRRGVMRDHTLSFTAKNVKIITVGTVVTLRGPVASAAERTTIEALARQTAGVTDVDDQLEVK